MPLSFTESPIATLQALVPGNQRGTTQLIAVGSNAYFVIIEQVGAAPGNNLRVYKSTDFVTWNLAAQYAGGAGLLVSQDCPACLVGTKIYIVGVDTAAAPVINLIVHRFDTTTDTFLADSILGPDQGGAGQQLWTVAPFNNGKLLIASSYAAPQPVKFAVQTYDTVTNTWGVTTTVVADSSNPRQSIHDAASDLVFVFYQKAATRELRCVSVSPALAFNDVTVSTWPAGGPFGSTEIGMPAICNGELAIPIRQFTVGPPILYLARSPVQAIPVFTKDLIEDTTTLPLNSQVQAYDQLAGPGWLAICVGGLLYVFYAIDNGELDSALSQAWLYYRSTSGPGVVSAAAIAFTGPVPSELAIPYAAAVGTSNPTILVGTFNPTTFPAVASLSNFILFSGGGPVGPTTTGLITSQDVYGPLPLPDPNLVCPAGSLGAGGQRTMKRRNRGCDLS